MNTDRITGRPNSTLAERKLNRMENSNRQEANHEHHISRDDVTRRGTGDRMEATCAGESFNIETRKTTRFLEELDDTGV